MSKTRPPRSRSRAQQISKAKARLQQDLKFLFARRWENPFTLDQLRTIHHRRLWVEEIERTAARERRQASRHHVR
jgi:hypothetical protein